MIVQPDCVPCLLKRVLFQSRLADGDRDMDSMRSALSALSENFEPGRKSVDIATPVHRASYDALGSDDPYLQLKVDADEVAARYMGVAQSLVDASEDKLRTALCVAVAGNIMDFGSGIAIDDPNEFESMFHDLVEQGIGSDDTDMLRDALAHEGDVTYIFDNCGESQLDRILIRLLRGMGKRVVGVARGVPILNDVTAEDAARSGLAEDLDALMTTGKFYIGVDWNDMPADLSDQIGRSCVVIAKGMANYESLSDERLPVPIVHVLRAKCRPVAESIGVPVGTNVVRFREPGC